MDNSQIFPLLSINDIYPFINLQQHYQFVTKHYLDYKKPSFGSFVTVERVLDRLDKWPEEVHGCHGDYDYLFNTITDNELLEKSIRLGSSTAFTDSRKQYFPSLLQDYMANIKVSVMLQPVFSVNNKGIVLLNTNKTNKTKRNKANKTNKTNNKTKKLKGNTNKTDKFTNDKYGLIVLDNNNPRATYLPHVFPSNTSWSDITSSLKSKGGVSTTQSITYKAYKTDEISATLFQFFTNKLILALRYLEIVLSLKFNSAGIPIYSISSTDYEIYKSDEYVRNCGICSDVIKAVYFIKHNVPKLYNHNLTDIKAILNKCETYLVSIYQLYSNLENIAKYRQATSFIVVGLIYLSIMKSGRRNNKYSKHIIDYCNDVIKNINELEPNFEYGECFVAVNTAVLHGFYTISKTQLKAIIDKTTGIISSLNEELQSIFAINWLIQMTCLSLNKNMLLLLKQLVNKLISIFYKYYNKQIVSASNKDNYILDGQILVLETNYLAVAYEAVLNIILSENVIFSDNATTGKKELQDMLVKLSITLINRKFKTDKGVGAGLYKFTSGEIRYDISGHTIVI